MLVPAVRARRSELPFTWMQFLIVARREILRKLLNRSFIVAMIGSLALVGAVAVFQYLQTSKSDKSMVVEAESAAVPLAQSLCAGWRGSGVVALCEPVEPGTAASQGMIRAQISLADSESVPKVTVTIPESIAGSGNQVAHAIAWQWIAVERGAADDQVRVALAADGAKTQDVVTRQLFAAALGCGFLFAGLMVGQQLAVSIVEDKKLGVYDTLRHLMPLRALIINSEHHHLGCSDDFVARGIAPVAARTAQWSSRIVGFECSCRLCSVVCSRLSQRVPSLGLDWASVPKHGCVA